jgi:hypothetical protein
MTKRFNRTRSFYPRAFLPRQRRPLRLGAGQGPDLRTRTISLASALATTALATGVLMGASLWTADEAHAGCIDYDPTSDPHTVFCDTAQTTIDDSFESNSPWTDLDYRAYEFGGLPLNTNDVEVTITTDGDIDGFGLSVQTFAPGAAMTVDHQGAISIDAGNNPTWGGPGVFSLITTGGNVIYTGNGSVIDNDGGNPGLVIDTGAGAGDINIGTAANGVVPNYQGTIGLYTVSGTGNQNIFLDGGTITTVGSSEGDAIRMNSSSGNLNLTLEGGTQLINADGAPGIISGINAFSSTGNITIVSDADIGTAGARFDTGINANSGGIIDITQSGNIFASSYGIFASGDTVFVENTGQIDAGDDGIVAIGLLVDVINSGSIAAGGDGINAEADTIFILNSGNIGTALTAVGGMGIVADGLDVEVENSGAIYSTGTGIHVLGGAIDITNAGTGTITTDGDDAHGINALTAIGSITIDNQGDISTMGAGSHGILAVRDGGAEPIASNIAITNSGDITTAGFGASGIVVSNDLGNFNVMVSGAVTTSGDAASAIDAFTDAGNGSVNTLAGVISTSGNNSAGVWAYANGSLNVAVGTATTTGDNSPGVDAFATGDVTVTALDVTTSGDFSTGILAGSELGDVDVTVTDVTTFGDHAPGVYAFTGSGDVTVTVLGDVEASGPGSSGVIVNTPDGLQSVFVAADASIFSGPDGSTPAAVVFEGTGMSWLVNHGLIRAANDRVVSSVSSSSTTIDNFGTMIGNVILGDGPDTFNNHGLFRARGDSFFGGGFDRFINTGTVRVIDGPVTFHGLDVFDNSDGIITMVDDVPNDSLTLPGDYVGGGLLAVDALLGAGGASDQLIIQGMVSGDPTAVAVNFLGIGPTSEGISVVRLENGVPAGQFFLADGPIDAGLFRVDLLGRPDGFLLVTIPDETSRPPTSTPGILIDIARETGDIDRMNEILDGEAEEALTEDDAVPGVAQVQPGSWAKIVGSSVTQDTRTSFTLADTPMRQTDSFDLGLVGIIGGLDISQTGVHEGTRYAWLVGVLGGYVWADVDFATATGTQDIEAAVFGGYGGLAYGGFRLHVLGKVDSGDVRFNEPDLAPGIAARGRSDFMTVSLETNVGYKFSLPNSMYVQPIASLYYSHTTLEAVTLGGTTVEFEDLDSLRARAGLRLGANIVSENYVLDPWVQASIWHELLDSDSKVTLASGGTSLDLIGAGVETYGEVGTGINVVRIGPGLSGQVRFDAKFGDLDLLALSGQVGLEYRFPVQ